MKWYVLDKNENFNLPEWSRTFGVDEDGLVFIPAAVAQIPENDVYLRMESDSNSDIPMAQYNEHYYMPSSWLSKAFPEIADVCQLFGDQAKKV